MQHGPAEADRAIRLVVMGVSGSGKTTIGRALAAELGVAFVDGDDLQPPSNVRKMASGIPLTDEDRTPWLASVGQVLADATDAAGVVVACSALRRAYRDAIRAVAADVVFVQLDVDEGALTDRMRRRRHPYMPASLLPSQLATLEPLAADEPGVVVDGSGAAAAVLTRVRTALSAALESGSL